MNFDAMKLAEKNHCSSSIAQDAHRIAEFGLTCLAAGRDSQAAIHAAEAEAQRQIHRDLQAQLAAAEAERDHIFAAGEAFYNWYTGGRVDPLDESTALRLWSDVAYPKEDEDRQRDYDHGPFGDATTPGFFKRKEDM